MIRVIEFYQCYIQGHQGYVQTCSMYIICEGMWSKWTNLLYTHSWCQYLLYYTMSIWALA